MTRENMTTNEKKEDREKLKSLNIYQKLSLVSRACETVDKDGKVDGIRGFRYATAGNIISMVNQNLFKYRLVAYVNYKLVETKFLQVTSKDGREQTTKFAAVEAVATIVNVDNPDEKINASAFGHGQDPGDTAIGKAQTYALKYMWLSTLQMQQMDENPEKDYEVHQQMVNQKPSYNNKINLKS